MRVFCYFNLHKKCFSIKALDGPDKGRVVAHADAVHLTEVAFKVSQAGRERVLREKCKNVHAGAVGTLGQIVVHGESAGATWDTWKNRFADNGTAVSYNPYKAANFFEVDTGLPVLGARECMLQGRSALVMH